MAITPIGPRLPAPTELKLKPTPTGVESSGDQASKATGGAAGAAAGSFQQLLTDAVTQIDGLQKNADAQRVKLATGQPVDLHDVTLAGEQAGLAFQLGLQVRNKLVEAYQEVMRMQV